MAQEPRATQQQQPRGHDRLGPIVHCFEGCAMKLGKEQGSASAETRRRPTKDCGERRVSSRRPRRV